MASSKFEVGDVIEFSTEMGSRIRVAKVTEVRRDHVVAALQGSGEKWWVANNAAWLAPTLAPREALRRTQGLYDLFSAEVWGVRSMDALPGAAQGFRLTARICCEAQNALAYYRARWVNLSDITDENRRALVTRILPLETVAEKPEHAADKLLRASGITDAYIRTHGTKLKRIDGSRIHNVWLSRRFDGALELDVEVLEWQ